MNKYKQTSILILSIYVLITYAFPSLITPASFLIVSLIIIPPFFVELEKTRAIELLTISVISLLLFFKIIPSPYNFLVQNQHIFQSLGILITLIYIVVFNLLVVYAVKKIIDLTNKNKRVKVKKVKN